MQSGVRRIFVLTPGVSEGWDDYIRGEYWITVVGGATLRDDQVQNAGHEAVALDRMLDFKVLSSGLLKRRLVTRSHVREAEGSSSTLLGIAGVFPLDSPDDIPIEIGAAAAGSMQRWLDIVEDPRDAYMKHESAIMAADLNFGVYRLTSAHLRAIQDHIFKLAGEQDVRDLSGGEVMVTQDAPCAAAAVPLADFLALRSPRELWLRYDRAGLG